MTGRTVVVGLLAAGLALAAGAWWLRGEGAGPVTIDSIGDRVQAVPRGRLPVFAAKPEVAELYRFAATEGDWAASVPCTCGCAELGHTSNRACYIKAETAERVTFTSHAAT
ncbi:MAG TPA: PCYCGC motif-containing (lipo)protein [Methylomirabilota bacterium]|nr:PCYCGC motif-containing (lipo)protein [Methylomirabilota bacterium]